VSAQLALAGKLKPLSGRFKLPNRVPPFSSVAHRLFTAIWAVAFLVAVIAPAMALYDRYTSPGDNSQLMLGSRAGFAVSPEDATRIRFTVGPGARNAGLRKGDDIIAIIEVPGVRKSDLDIRIERNTLRISGSKSVEYGDKVATHRRERAAGRFDRAVTLPIDIDADKIRAECRDGILALYLPRAERDKPRSITLS